VTFFFLWGASASTMLSSAEFICLCVAYREVFWEELSRLIWRYDVTFSWPQTYCDLVLYEHWQQQQ